MSHTLQNQHLRVTIRNQGAELTSLFNRQTGIEHLWQANPAVWPWHAPNLFPVVGGQTNDQIVVDGQTYPMKRHGFARTSEFTCTESSEEAATFALSSSEATKDIFPYDFLFEIIYQLDGPKLAITYRVTNQGADTMFMSVGAHPAFSVPFRPDEAYTDYYIEFDQDESLETSLLGTDGLLTGETARIDLDNRQLNLTPTLFDNDALVLLGLKSRQVTLRSRRNNHSIRLDFADFVYLGLWAKPGAPFVCIEPWLGVADTSSDHRPFEKKQGIQCIPANEAFTAQYSITVK
ncbi:aldose 1-epimerase family protein [Fibrella aquatica]|jgi:galactose mutarotase-like enzyme|uniref:aldose 1-epimerase family protein n=1 Tax=Fibrella aquatica TaxID=3242487 RepID=UPI00351FA785